MTCSYIHVPALRAQPDSLNTIIEANREPSMGNDYRNHSDTSTDEGRFCHRDILWDPNTGMEMASGRSMNMQTSPASEKPYDSVDAWTRGEIKFDDLYDATEDEAEVSNDSFSGNSDDYIDGEPRMTRKGFPPLKIPYDKLHLDMASCAKDSPLPPTPPPKLPLSPEALSRIPRVVPAVHAPPSLDGSGTSDDQNSVLSNPRTPDADALRGEGWKDENFRLQEAHEDDGNSSDASSSGRRTPELDIQLEIPEDWSHVLGNFPRVPGNVSEDDSPVLPDPNIDEPVLTTSEIDNGIQLPSQAVDLLQHFGFDDNADGAHQIPQVQTTGEMLEVPAHARRHKSAIAALPASAGSNEFTPLSVPSPGAFFTSLREDTRRTWCLATSNPPSSAAAENFYSRPWEAPPVDLTRPPNNPVDIDNASVTRRPSSDASTLGGAIMRPSQKNGNTLATLNALTNEGTAVVVEEYDESYEEELKNQASVNIDRTSGWLATQTAYLAALQESEPAKKVEKSPTPSGTKSTRSKAGSFSKKPGSGLETIHEAPSSPEVVDEETLFYRNFKRLARRSRLRDTFLHSNFRFEAVQAERLGFMEKHVDQLEGRYAISSPVRPPYRGPFSHAPRNSTVPEILADQAKFMRLEKEQDIAHQLHASMWAIEALKFLNGGRLIPSPAFKRLGRASTSMKSPGKAGRRQKRALDLGGNTSCSWAWYFSHEFPNAKLYTLVNNDQITNPEIEGPSNHRQISVPHMWRLPFRDNQFEIISARTFHCLLKRERPMGENADEFDLCLRECYRCLKPGGYLEFFLMDSEIVHAGPYGSAVSVEFGFNLKTRGYDPAPTSSFLFRVKKANFVDVKRAWMFLPIGSTQGDPQVPGALSADSEEITGSTTDIASTTGLFGGWMWEQWMLKIQMEMGRDRGKLLEEMANVFAEGRNCGAGWRCLSGWAMKPKN